MPGESGDLFVLEDDGTVTLRWDTDTVTLRRPKIREMRSFLEEQERATETLDELAEDGRIKTVSLLGTAEKAGAYSVLMARVIGELGGVDAPDPEDLAPWMAKGTTFGHLAAHWQESPLDRSERAGLLQAILASQTTTPPSP